MFFPSVTLNWRIRCWHLYAWKPQVWHLKIDLHLRNNLSNLLSLRNKTRGHFSQADRNLIFTLIDSDNLWIYTRGIQLNYQAGQCQRWKIRNNVNCNTKSLQRKEPAIPLSCKKCNSCQQVQKLGRGTDHKTRNVCFVIFYRDGRWSFLVCRYDQGKQ